MPGTSKGKVDFLIAGQVDVLIADPSRIPSAVTNRNGKDTIRNLLTEVRNRGDSDAISAMKIAYSSLLDLVLHDKTGSRSSRHSSQGKY